MNIGETLYITNRKDWRTWLKKNYKTKKEIWLIFYHKKTGKTRIPYSDAVEEALCYGWIDSIAKGFSQESFVQRFSVRKNTSVFSQMNKERVFNLMAKKKMTKAGLSALSHVFDPKKDKLKNFNMPEDILKSLKADKKIWKNFQKFSDSYKRIRIAYVERQKRQGQDHYQKALKHLIEMTSRNKQYGTWRD